MGYSDEVGGRSTADLPSENEPVPAGWYDVTITGVEDKQTRNMAGAYLKIEHTIDGPTCAGRKIWTMAIYRHSNEDAERIGLAKLHALTRAMGRESAPRDLVSFGGARVRAKVKIKEATAEFEASNDVVTYKAIDRAAVPTPAPTPQPQARGMAAPPAPVGADEYLPF